MNFVNPDVDAQFECLVEADRQVHKLGLYSGLLSKITLPMAEHLTSKPSNLIKRKDGVGKVDTTGNNKPASTPTKPSKPGTTEKPEE